MEKDVAGFALRHTQFSPNGNIHNTEGIAMKGGRILGGVGGLLGMGLLTKGIMGQGGSLLSTLLSSLGGGQRRGCQGGGRGRGAGGRNGMSDGTSLTEVLQSALERLAAQPQTDVALWGSQALPQGQDGRIIDVTSAPVEAHETEQQKVALALLADALVSYVPGRARLRHAAFQIEAKHLELRSCLLEAGFREATFKASTGSVLLTWDSTVWDKSTFFAAALPLGRYILDQGGGNL
ncbi:MAG: hypothetical protein IJU37_10780 [Desulfovibrio sp.]|nr:hypothetical protein [Desulfovibrio sp.]